VAKIIVTPPGLFVETICHPLRVYVASRSRCGKLAKFEASALPNARAQLVRIEAERVCIEQNDAATLWELQIACDAMSLDA
jgi:hypothetical protein